MIFQRFNKVVKVKLTIIIVLHMKLCAFKVNFCKACVLSFFQISWISSWNKNSSNSGTLGKTWVGTCNCRNSGPDPGRLAQIFWMNPSTGATFVMDFPGRFRLCSHSVSWSFSSSSSSHSSPCLCGWTQTLVSSMILLMITWHGDPFPCRNLASCFSWAMIWHPTTKFFAREILEWAFEVVLYQAKCPSAVPITLKLSLKWFRL